MTKGELCENKYLSIVDLRDVTISMVQNDAQKHIGSKVIWGGQIFDMTNDSGVSVLTVLDMKLYADRVIIFF